MVESMRLKIIFQALNRCEFNSKTKRFALKNEKKNKTLNDFLLYQLKLRNSYLRNISKIAFIISKKNAKYFRFKFYINNILRACLF